MALNLDRINAITKQYGLEPSSVTTSFAYAIRREILTCIQGVRGTYSGDLPPERCTPSRVLDTVVDRVETLF
jgi:hypothetical protein